MDKRMSYVDRVHILISRIHGSLVAGVEVTWCKTHFSFAKQGGILKNHFFIFKGCCRDSKLCFVFINETGPWASFN